jgi:hypothetical protein
MQKFFTRPFLITLGFLSAVALAAAGDRFVNNPNLDSDIKIQVNDGGSTTTPLQIKGSTTQTLLNDGSVSAPSIGFQNSSTTGLYRSGSNAIGISINGAVGANVSSPGEWTFGPADAVADHQVRGNLVVRGKTGSQTWLNVQNNSSASQFTVNSTGSTILHGNTSRLGIGSGPAVYFYLANPGPGTACTTECANIDNSTHGLDADSGTCIAAWIAASGVTSTCGDTAGGKICSCQGVVL